MSFDETKCLAFSPFDCDRDSDVRVFSDRIVTAAKEHQCCICLDRFPKGSRSRARTEKCDGQLMTFRMCEPCCEAMAISWEDEGLAIEKRTRLGIDRVQP